MKKNNLPRGIRNNNPANIVRTGQRWLGLSKVQTDKRFCQFDDMKYGVRAFFVLARTYRLKYGIKCVIDFIKRFAPSTENDLNAYVSFIQLTENLDGLIDNTDYVHLLYAIIRYENHFSDFEMFGYALSHFDLNKIRKEFNIIIV